MGNRQKMVLFAIVLLAGLLCYWGLGCSSNKSTTSGSSGVGAVSGTILTSEGQPVEGAVVVVGENSPHTVTDHNGQFTINNVAAGTQKFNVIAGGFYTHNNSTISVNGTTALSNVQVKEFDGDMDDLPLVSITSASISGTILSVSATITPGVNADAITDVRAELLYYNTGIAMSLPITTTSVFATTATITIPSNAVGPYLSLVVFAFDANHKVGQDHTALAYSGGTGTGSFTLTTINGPWSGPVRYHRNYRDNDNKQRAIAAEANTAITITGASAAGKYAEPRLWRLINGLSPIETGNLNNGTVTLVDANLGLYTITFSYTGVSRTATTKLLARCDSATSPAHLYGLLQITDIDTTSGITVTNRYNGRFHFQLNNVWATADFNGAWVLSDYFGISGAGTAGGQYVPPFQYNEAFSVQSGVVTSGSTTLGPTISSGTFTITDTALGAYTAVITTSDNAVTTLFGLMDMRKNYLHGIKMITSGAATEYGYFWGPKSANPRFSMADFASIKTKGTVVNSVFLGLMRVITSTGADAGKFYWLGFNFDASGNIVGGAVNTLLGVRVATFTAGSVVTFDTTSGKFTLSATGTGCTFTISNRNASMGVCKARLVGDFTFTNGGITDNGYFFMGRRPE